MPNARQLLEQADALMRRNRKRGKGKGGGPPTLTDALGVDATGTLAPTIILAEGSPQAADPIHLGALPRPDGTARPPAPADPIGLDTLSDLPVLTDIVDAWPAQPAQEWPPTAADPAARTLDDALEVDALAIPAEMGTINTVNSSQPPAPLLVHGFRSPPAPACKVIRNGDVTSPLFPIWAGDISYLTPRTTVKEPKKRPRRATRLTAPLPWVRAITPV